MWVEKTKDALQQKVKKEYTLLDLITEYRQDKYIVCPFPAPFSKRKTPNPLIQRA